MPGKSQKGSSLASKIDFNNLWKYAPENEAEANLLRSAGEYIERAEELDRKSKKGSGFSHLKTSEVISAYGDFVEETGYEVEPKEFLDLLDAGRPTQTYEFAREQYMELAESVLEDYVELMENKVQAKKTYLQHFGIDDFDIDPNKGPVLKQVTTQDLIDHFFDKQAKKN